MSLMKSTAVSLALAVSLAACGGGDSGTDAKDAATGDYTPLTAKNLGSEMAEAMSDAGTVHVGGDMGGQKIDMWMEIDGADTAMKGDMGDGEMLYVDGEFYMKEAGAKKWSSLPPEFAKMMTSSLGDMSPVEQAKQFNDALEKLTYEGEKKVKGETLYAYDIDLDEKYALEKARKQAEQMGGSATDIPEGSLPETTLLLLLDEDNLMRQIEIGVSGQKIIMTMDQWGEDVDIEAPAASDVEKMTMP